jgi:hypothetical protein
VAKPCSFDDWLNALFGHDADSFEKYLRFRGKSRCVEISSRKEIEYVTQAFENAGTVFARFTNDQLHWGFWYLISSNSNTMNRILLEAKIEQAVTERCVRSFYDVYAQLFAKRCSPYVSHGRQTTENPLNSVCYMWWDIFPFWGSLVGKPYLDDLFLQVMERTLELPSIPCQESALHGLGHIPTHQAQVIEIIDRYLARNPNLDTALQKYALRAQESDIL